MNTERERERPDKWPAEPGLKPQINVISNRELQVLDSPLNQRKQRTAPRSNRELSTLWGCSFYRLKVEQACTASVSTFLSRTLLVLLIFVMSAAAPLAAHEKRKVIIDEDCSGPGGTNTQAILALIQSPDTEVLGITIVTGDAWRDEEVQHALRLMEIIGRTDIPVVPGAAFPLVSSKEFIVRWETLYGN